MPGLTSDVIVIPEGEHSDFGPSSSDRWMNCPGSRGQGQTRYAAEGSVAHWLSEQVRHTGKHASAWKGRVVRSGDYEFKIGKPFIDSVTTFVADVQRFKGIPLVEERVRYDEVIPGGFGTLDDASLQEGIIPLTDLKHGKGVVVEAKENSQLMLYGFGVWLKYRWLYDIDGFLLRICQPRRKHFPEWKVSLGEILRWVYDVVRPAYRRALVSNERVAGPWCKFCGYKHECSERARYKMEHESGTYTFTRDPDEELETLED